MTEEITEPENPRGKVLLAEDNDINHQLATAILARLGYLTDLVDNGFAALELVRMRHYHAVLMDLRLPGMDGLATTAELRRREGDARHTPVIAITATDSDRDRYLAAGADDCLVQPLVPRDLRTVLERWTGEAPASRG